MNKENEPLRKKQKMLTSFFEVESWSTIDDTLHFTVPAVEYEGGVEGAEEEEVFDDIEESEEEGDQKKKEDEEKKKEDGRAVLWQRSIPNLCFQAIHRVMQMVQN